MIGLGDLPGGIYRSRAYAVSADGSVIVGKSLSGPDDEPFRWTQETGMVGLGFLHGIHSFSAAFAVSADGQVVVGQSVGEAFVWDEVNGMRSVKEILEQEGGYDLSHWYLDRATGVAHLPDGTIVICGYGGNPNLQTEGWVAIIPSPPSVLPLGLMCLVGWRRRH